MNQSNKIIFLKELMVDLAKSKKEVVYVAGKVTGLSVYQYTEKFSASKTMLQGMGYHVLNPCDYVSDGTPWEEAMRYCISLLSMADIIYLQSDWRDSPGAMIEHTMAVKLGLNCIYQ